MDKNSKICILGFGTEGKATLEYLIRHNYFNITVCDKNVDLKEVLPQGVSCSLGENYMEDLEQFDVIFRTPGIPYLNPSIQKALAKGVLITSAMRYFLENRPCKVVGVTGTKGKGTTSTMTYQLLSKKFSDCYLAGNIGNSPIEFLDDLKEDSIVVLEMSCFQLQDLKISPDYAIFLNTTVDHLDYHADTFEYMQAKESILAHQNENGVLVINKDYEYSKYYKPLAKGRIYEVSRKEKVENGAFLHKRAIFFVKDGVETKICKLSDVKLIGSHNLENVMPSICIAKELEVDDASILDVIKSFSGLEHRLEKVRELNGVSFYNDSFSTNAETSMAGVDSFDEDTVLIAGGHDKGIFYDEWAKKILTKKNLHCVILIGDVAEKMEKALEDASKELGDSVGSPTKILRRNTFESAVLDAYAEAQSPGVVLLSPGSSSFGLFKDYKERGQRFKDLVNALH